MSIHKPPDGDNHPEQRTRTSLLDRLRSSTILGILHQVPKIPENIVEFMRRWSLGSDLTKDNDPNDPTNDHKWAFNRVQRLWASAPDKADRANDISNVSKFNTALKLCTAYWTGEKSKQAWMQTGLIAGLSAFFAQDVIWGIQASAELLGHMANFKPGQAEGLSPIYNSASKILGFGVLGVVLKDQLDSTRFAMRRSMTNWMTDEFMSAIYDENDEIKRFTHNRQKGRKPEERDADAMPENPHQALGENINFLNQLVTWFGAESIGVVCTTALVTKALYEKSVPIDFLGEMSQKLHHALPNGVTEFMSGDKGSFALAMACGAGFLGLVLPKAKSICKDLEENYMQLMKKNGDFTSFLVNTFDRGDSIAATKSHKPWQEAYEELHSELRENTRQNDDHYRRYQRYQELTSLVGSKVLPLVPGFTAFTSGKLNLQGYSEMQLLITGSIWAINNYIMSTLPSISRIKTYANDLAEIATMVDKTTDKAEFYRLSGIHEFKRGQIVGENVALSMKNLELMHKGFDAQPFLTVPLLELKAGDWALVDGVSGSGKSCLFQSISNIWGYGRGEVQTHKDSKIFYAKQEPDVDRNYSLAEQIVYGMDGIQTSLKNYVNQKFGHQETVRQRIEWALNAAGLDEFTDRMNEKTHNGRMWENVLSGGQKQRLVLARILFQQPDIILLDEAASALNPEARQFFFNTLKAECPEATVVAIIHDEKVPHDKDGQPLFDKKLKIEKGVAALEDLITPPVTPFAHANHRLGADFETIAPH